MKVYITLNEEKDKDMVIIEYLMAQYSKSGHIKDILYKLAVNDGNLPVIGTTPKTSKKQVKTVKSSKKVNIEPKGSKNQQNGTTPKRGKKQLNEPKSSNEQLKEPKEAIGQMEAPKRSKKVNIAEFL